MTREEAITRLKSDVYQYADFSENPNEDEFWEAFDMAIKALEQQPCEDAISREAVNKAINKWLSSPYYDYKNYIYEMTKTIHELPSVKPQRAKGHLVSNQQDGEVKPFWERYRCSVCGEYAQDNFNYCSRCGAELEGEEE